MLLSHGRRAEALWELSSRSGAAPLPSVSPSRTHPPTCCLIYPESACSSLVVVLSGDNSLNGTRHYREPCRESAGQGLWGTERIGSTGNPPALTVCQGCMESSRRWVLPWLSPQESPQHVMLTQGFLYHHRDPLSLVLKNNSGIIPVPPSLQLCSPWKSSAGA